MVTEGTRVKYEKAREYVKSGLKVVEACEKAGIHFTQYYKAAKELGKKKVKRSRSKLIKVEPQAVTNPFKAVVFIGTELEVLEAVRKL